MRRSVAGGVGLCALLALVGCGSSKPAPDREPDEQAVRGISHFDRAPVIDDFARKVSERNAQGWPPSVTLASDGSGKVQARLETPVNAGARECDLAAFHGELLQALSDQGVLALELPPDAAPSSSEGPPKTGRRAAPQAEPAAPTHAPETGRGTAPPEREDAEEADAERGLRIVTRIEDGPGGGSVITIQLVGERPIITTRASFR